MRVFRWLFGFIFPMVFLVSAVIFGFYSGTEAGLIRWFTTGVVVLIASVISFQGGRIAEREAMKFPDVDQNIVQKVKEVESKVALNSSGIKEEEKLNPFQVALDYNKWLYDQENWFGETETEKGGTGDGRED
jgi:hypothetical protein